MKRLPWLAVLFAGILMFANAGRAATVHGTVNNGTTGKPGAGVEVILIQLQGGMLPVANTKTNGAGQFTFENPNIGGQPMLIRAVYKGVNFHQPLPPGKDAITVDVFEPSGDSRIITVPSHVVVFQPNGDKLTVGEEYGVKNDSKPPQALFKTAGNFEVTLPDGVDLKQIAAAGPSGMPVVQAPIDKGKNRYAIAFAFRPGESVVRLSYDLPYTNNAATVKLPTTYGGRLLVVVPPSVQVTGDGLQMAGQEQGMNIYERASVTVGTAISISLSGGGAPGRAENVQGGENSATIQSVPGRLDGLKWPLIGGFCILFALAAVLLARKPVAIAVTMPESSAAASTPTANTPAAKAKAPRDAKASTAENGAGAETLASIDRNTTHSLDALKEQLFRLEIRHQAGTISEEEYSRQRAKAEQILRDLVKG